MARSTPRQEPKDRAARRLAARARAAMKNAHAPYSEFKVGAAILLRDGRIFTGCNVENASYGLTICAERNAIFAAVAASKKKPEIAAVVVVNNQNRPCSPCGACRQVIAEFGPRAVVWYLAPEGFRARKLTALLPDGFTFD